MDDLTHARARRLEDANHWLDILAEMIEKHAEAVDGRDRAELRELSVQTARRRDAIGAVIAAGPEAVRELGAVDVTDILEDIAMAGAVALQILGGRLARNEGWG